MSPPAADVIGPLIVHSLELFHVGPALMAGWLIANDSLHGHLALLKHLLPLDHCAHAKAVDSHALFWNILRVPLILRVDFALTATQCCLHSLPLQDCCLGTLTCCPAAALGTAGLPVLGPPGLAAS